MSFFTKSTNEHREQVKDSSVPSVQVGGFSFPEVLKGDHTIRRMVELWKLPIGEDLLGRIISCQNPSSDSSTEEVYEGPWGEKPIGKYYRHENSPEELRHLEMDIDQLANLLNSCRNITSDPKRWAFDFYYTYGGRRGYRYCRPPGHFGEDLSSTASLFKGINISELVQDFHTEGLRIAKEILAKSFLEDYKFNDPDPAGRYFYVTFDALKNSIDNSFLSEFSRMSVRLPKSEVGPSNFIFLDLAQPDAPKFENEEGHLLVLCKLPGVALEKLGVEPKKVKNGKATQKYKHGKPPILSVSEVFNVPDVEDLSAFEEVFFTLIKDGWNLTAAYETAQKI